MISLSATEAPELTVNNYPHPEWCDLTRCSPHIHSSRPGGYHQSAGTLWTIQSDEADFIARVVRDDDFDRQGRQVGRARLEIILRNHASCPPTGGDRDDWWVEAGVDPDDARILATMLTRYADMSDRTNHHPAADLPAVDINGRSIQ